MNREHVDKLLEGVQVFNPWREANPNVKVDLSEAYLSGEDLNVANLTGANLSEAIK